MRIPLTELEDMRLRSPFGQAGLQGAARLYGEALRAADSDRAVEIALKELSNGRSLPEVYAEVIQPAMYWIGDLWRDGSIGVGDEHLATAISEKVLAALYPAVLDQRGAPRPGSVLLAGVEGEEHCLGLRMVADTLESRGHRVEYLGTNVSKAALLNAVRIHNPSVVGLSITMAPNSAGLVETIDALSGWPVRVVVGGQAASAASGFHSVVDLPDVDELPMAADLGQLLRSGPQTYRRDSGSGPAFYPNEGGAVEAELERVVRQSTDMARAAMRGPEGDPLPGEDDPFREPRKRTDLEVVSELFAAIDRKEVDTAVRLIHPEVRWSPSAWSGSSVLRSRTDVIRWFDQFGPDLKNLRIELAEIRLSRAKDPRGWTVVLGTVHDTRGNEPFSARVGWRFAVADGMVSEGFSHGTWEEALEAAGCSTGTSISTPLDE